MADGVPSWRRIGGWAGMVFAVGMVVFLAVLDAGAPNLGDPMSDIREYFDDSATLLLIGMHFGALLFVGALILFASGLRSLLARGEEDGGFWPRASFAGAVLTVAVSGVGTLFWSALAMNGTEQFSDSTVQALMHMDALTYGMVASWGFALFIAAASISILRTGVLPAWMGTFGLATALVLIVGAFWVLDGDPEGALAIIGLVSFAAVLVWSFLVGLAMVRSDRSG